jgi:hypothetical protein
MLRRYQNAVWFALAILLAIGWGAVIWQASNISHPSIKQNTEAKKDNQPNSKTIEERHQATEEAIAYYNKWLMFFTAILALATMGLGGSTLGLYFAGERQLRLARDEFISSHRPKIRVKHIWLSSQDGQHFIGKLESGTPITVRLDIVNIGGTPAFINLFNFMTHTLIAGQRLPQRPPYNEPGVRQFQVGGSPLGSGITFTQILSDGRILTEQDIRNIRVGTPQLYFIGTVEYWDGNDPPRLRQTAFCRCLDFERLPAHPNDDGRFRKVENPDYEYQD